MNPVLRSLPNTLPLALAVSTGIVLIGLFVVIVDSTFAWMGISNGPVEIGFALSSALLVLNLGIVGGILTLRRPDNAIGWLLLAAGLASAISFGGAVYAALADVLGGGQLPLVVPIAWVSSVMSTPVVVLLVVFLPMLFPTGRLPGPRWRLVAALAIGAASIGAVAAGTRPGPLPLWHAAINNPVEVPAWILGPIGTLELISNLTGPPAFLVVIAGLVGRFRAARGPERQQLKWFLSVASITAIALGSSILAPGQAVSDAAWLVGVVAMSCLPIAIGIAILRYRLYEIDRIVSRAIAYTLVTAVLAAVFGLGVLGSEAILASVTGSGSVAVAASTLAVAALFQPVRRAIQAAVDRRFDRRRVDAEEAVRVLAAQLRDRLDLPSIAGETRTAVQRTLRPTFADFWLRQPRDG